MNAIDVELHSTYDNFGKPYDLAYIIYRALFTDTLAFSLFNVSQFVSTPEYD